MEKIVIVDTNFLVSNMGNNRNNIKEIEEKGLLVYIPELVKDEFINIQLRKVEEVYNKLENLGSLKEVINLKYTKKELVKEEMEKAYNRIFNANFDGKIIQYNKSNMLDRVLERNKQKMPPFYNESNSSDKGFKDTIILLSIMDFISDYKNETEFYFVTSDNGFIKYKNEIESELFYKCAKNVTIIEGKDKSNIYKKLNINNTEEKEKNNPENIFSKNEINIEEIRESKYKESFINYIAQRINENKINDISTVESNDDLPF